MTTTNGNEDLPGAIAQRSTRLNAVIHRWHQALVDIRQSLFSGGRRQRIDARRRDRHAPRAELTQVAGELVPLPDERSQALAVLCDRLLHELDGEEVNAAEIRFVVHKHEHPSYPRLDPESKTGVGDGELATLNGYLADPIDWDSEFERLLAGEVGPFDDLAGDEDDEHDG